MGRLLRFIFAQPLILWMLWTRFWVRDLLQAVCILKSLSPIFFSSISGNSRQCFSYILGCFCFKDIVGFTTSKESKNKKQNKKMPSSFAKQHTKFSHLSCSPTLPTSRQASRVGNRTSFSNLSSSPNFLTRVFSL